MAIGIDRYEHGRLMERLGKLIQEDSDPAQWQELERELSGAYSQLGELVRETEQSAIRYRKLNEEIRPQISLGLRKLKQAKTSK